LPHAPPGYGSSPHFPYPGRLLSFGHVYGDTSERILHKYIQCDACGVQPIVGPRYKSNVREDYDLCGSCFKRMGNEMEYTKIDKPVLQRLSRDPSVHRKVHTFHPRVLMKSKREKLESRFILDVTVLDGTLMAPSTQFTKIWRMHNNGSITWPLGTQLIWVGGDHFALHTSVPLEIPVNGFPVDKEIDVAVDFVSPSRPGRYISYWRLASPSCQKFGQRVWVHIQVEDPSFVNGKNKNAINLNLPPENNSSSTTNLIDVNIEPFASTQGYHSYPVDVSLDTFEPKKSQPVPFTFIVPVVSAEASTNSIAGVPFCNAPATAVAPSVSVPTPEPVVPTVHLPVSMPDMTATTAAANTLVSVPNMTSAILVADTPVSVPNMSSATPVADMPVSVPNMTTTTPTSVNVFASTPTSASVSVPSEPFDKDGETEEKQLRELAEMGFKEVDLNKEILRQNNYNLEQSVDDLCGVNEWDPLLAELEEMGFDDTEMNKELLEKNGGSIKRAVMDLIAREEKDS
jgi:next-to-BRCA1 protein 1